MRLHWLVLLVLTVALLTGCGGSSSAGGGSDDADPAQAMPAGTLVYIEGVVRPDGDQKDAASALLAKFLPSGTTLESLLDKNLQEDEPGKTYAKDIEPWLGERVGIGLRNFAGDEPDYLAALDVTDAGKAEAYLKSSDTAEQQGEYQGSTVYQDDDQFAAVKDDYLFLASSEADLHKGMDAADGDSLADGKAFEDAVDKLPDERLGSLFVDLKGVSGLIDTAPDLDPAGRAVLKQVVGPDAKPITAALTATTDSATVEGRFSGLDKLSSLGLVGGTSTDLIKDAPADAFAAYGVADVGSTAKGAIATFAGALGGAALTGQLESQLGINLDRDVFSWIGDVAVYAHGDSLQTLNGAVVIAVSDEDAADAAIPRLIAAAKRSGAPIQNVKVAGADDAVAIPAPEAPGPVVLAKKGDRVVLAFGEKEAAAALDPGSDTLGSAGAYDSAKDAIDGLEPTVILSLSKVLTLAEATGETDADFEEAKPYLEKLDQIVSGSEKDGDDLRTLFTVTTK